MTELSVGCWKRYVGQVTTAIVWNSENAGLPHRLRIEDAGATAADIGGSEEVNRGVAVAEGRTGPKILEAKEKTVCARIVPGHLGDIGPNRLPIGRVGRSPIKELRSLEEVLIVGTAN